MPGEQVVCLMASTHLPASKSSDTNDSSTRQGDPVWVLVLMEYFGRLSVAERAYADSLHSFHDHLRDVGSRLIMEGWVTDLMAGDGRAWDRVGVLHFRDVEALAEMQTAPATSVFMNYLQDSLRASLVLPMFPDPRDARPEQASAISTEARLVLLQVVDDDECVDLADGLESTRIGRFRVRPGTSSSGRSFDTVRFDLVSPTEAVQAASNVAAMQDRGGHRNHAMIVRAQLDDIARSLQDPTRVRF